MVQLQFDEFEALQRAKTDADVITKQKHVREPEFVSLWPNSICPFHDSTRLLKARDFARIEKRCGWDVSASGELTTTRLGIDEFRKRCKSEK